VARVLELLPEATTDGRAHSALVDAARDVIAAERARLAREPRGEARSAEVLAIDVAARVADVADAWRSHAGAINATGVLIHTNLGRSTWPAATIEAARVAASAPMLLEIEPESGRRGRRFRDVEDSLIALTGAEDAIVVNNNAAAVALAVGLAGRGGGVVVARGELVEIGGGVRIPDIVRRAGARLIEVGTANKTRADDFVAAIADSRVRVVLRIHRSNFRVEGFVEDPDFRAVAAAAHERGAIVIDDLGSGALLDTSAFGLAHEPLPRERLAAGADLVTFSGDKLVGGPQAGFIVGRAELVARLRRDPLARAMRPDKVTLAAIAATLGLYRSGRAEREIPLWRSVATSLADLQVRASVLAAALDAVAIPTDATLGGGSLPGETLPSAGISIAAAKPDLLARRLRTGRPAVVPRIDHDRVVFDLRSVEPERDHELEAGIRAALRPASRQPR